MKMSAAEFKRKLQKYGIGMYHKGYDDETRALEEELTKAYTQELLRPPQPPVAAGIDTRDPDIYDEPGSWGRLSEGWPSTGDHAEAKFALCGRGRYLPYGSYVLVDSNTPQPRLRVASQAQLNDLNDTFKVLRSIFRDSRG